MRKHIDLYVNNYSIDLGERGRFAVNKLLKVYAKTNLKFNEYPEIFISRKPAEDAVQR
jgi:1,4-dihydroxy-6-naphthoate synthase